MTPFFGNLLGCCGGTLPPGELGRSYQYFATQLPTLPAGHCALSSWKKKCYVCSLLLIYRWLCGVLISEYWEIKFELSWNISPWDFRLQRTQEPFSSWGKVSETKLKPKWRKSVACPRESQHWHWHPALAEQSIETPSLCNWPQSPVQKQSGGGAERGHPAQTSFWWYGIFAQKNLL